jgi:hypothetical protein
LMSQSFFFFLGSKSWDIIFSISCFLFSTMFSFFSSHYFQSKQEKKKRAINQDRNRIKVSFETCAVTSVLRMTRKKTCRCGGLRVGLDPRKAGQI